MIHGMIAAMRALLIAAFGIAVVATGPSGQAQGLLAKPGVQHASVVATSSRAAASAGTLVTLWADVTPNPSMHIYAEGAKDFTPVSLVLTPNTAVAAGKAALPNSDMALAAGESHAARA